MEEFKDFENEIKSFSSRMTTDCNGFWTEDKQGASDYSIIIRNNKENNQNQNNANGENIDDDSTFKSFYKTKLTQKVNKNLFGRFTSILRL